MKSAPCPTPEQHTHPEADRLGYIAWHEWAEQMQANGYSSERCPGCGQYKVHHAPGGAA